MADEYIKREETYTIAKKICNAIRNGEYHSAVFARDIMDWIDDVPAADVVPVVRCKDCKHVHAGLDIYYCRWWDSWGINPDGFCSCGAKMDGEA